MALAPTWTAMRASSTRMIPFTMKGPSHCSRNHWTSRHVGGGVCRHRPPASAKLRGGSPGPWRLDTGRVVSWGTLRWRSVYLGRATIWGANWTKVFGSIRSDTDVLPQSRPRENGQSSVRTGPRTPRGRSPLDSVEDLVTRARMARGGHFPAVEVHEVPADPRGQQFQLSRVVGGASDPPPVQGLSHPG